MITRRFERDDESGVRRFFELELDGVHLSVRRGRAAGGLIDGKRRTFESVDEATADAEQRMAAWRISGWKEVGPAPVYPSRNPRFEAAIVDDPDDIAAWSVYADWLLARGDRFGEWLALSLSGSLSDPNTRELWSTELLWLADRVDLDTFARLEHRHGFVLRARISEPKFGRLGPMPQRFLAALLRSPTSWLLRGLAVGWLSNTFQVDALLGKHDSIMLEHLRELVLGDPVDDEIFRSFVCVGDLARVLQACPTLETLHVRGTAVRWGSEDGGTIANLHPLFDDERTLPGLRELALVNCDFADAVAEALAHSNRLARLEHVDLSLGTLGDRGARAILEHAAAFQRLRSLDLDGNYLSPELADALRAALPGIVRIGEQVDPAIGRRGGRPGYYVAVDE